MKKPPYTAITRAAVAYADGVMNALPRGDLAGQMARWDEAFKGFKAGVRWKMKGKRHAKR